MRTLAMVHDGVLLDNTCHIFTTVGFDIDGIWYRESVNNKSTCTSNCVCVKTDSNGKKHMLGPPWPWKRRRKTYGINLNSVVNMLFQLTFLEQSGAYWQYTSVKRITRSKFTVCVWFCHYIPRKCAVSRNGKVDRVCMDSTLAIGYILAIPSCE